MRAIVVTGGLGPRKQHTVSWTKGADLVCACDSGYHLANTLGLDIDLMVGDMDSIDDRAILTQFAPDTVMEYPEEKDETDTEIGVRTAKERGADEVVILGGGGGRLDHLLGILALFHRDEAVRAWITDTDEAVQIASHHMQKDLEGQTVSFFPLHGESCTMSTEGLKWPLDELCWTVGDSGISNVVVATQLVVRMHTGRLLMVRALR